MLILSFKKIFRTNQIVFLFLVIAYIFFLYIALYTNEIGSFLRTLNLAISYACLLLTGGHLKDEINNGYMDMILHRTGRVRIVWGKFLSILIFSFVCYILLSLLVGTFLILDGDSSDFKSSFLTIAKGFLVTIYLISVGIFLSLYLKGFFNFAFIFFLQFATAVFIEYFFDIFTLFEKSEKISNTRLFFISLFFPQLIYLTTNGFIFFVLPFFSVLFILLTIYLFMKIEIKKG